MGDHACFFFSLRLNAKSKFIFLQQWFLHWACQLVHSSCTGVHMAASHVFSNVQLCADAIQHGRAGWEPSATNLGPDATNITLLLMPVQ